MSIEGLAVALVLTVIVAVSALWPLIQRRAARNAAGSLGLQRERLALYYERVLRNIQDLDEDFATGKLNEDEYRTEREQWTQRGIAALRAMEQDQAILGAAPTDTASLDRDIEAAIEASIEASVSARRAGQQAH